MRIDGPAAGYYPASEFHQRITVWPGTHRWFVSIWRISRAKRWKGTSKPFAITPLEEAAKLFNAQSPYVFLVLRHSQLIGWMSYHHLLCIPFRACLFSLLLGIEQAMLDVVIMTEPGLAVSKLPNGRLNKSQANLSGTRA
jgi:hypothetical protein